MAFIPSSGGGGVSQRTAGFSNMGQRACYILFSSGNYDFTWLNQDFGTLIPSEAGASQSWQYHTLSDAQRYGNSTYKRAAMTYFNQAGSTNSTPSSSSGFYYNCHASNTAMGAYCGYFYSDGSYSDVADNSYGWYTRAIDRHYVIPSNHSNRAILYLIYNGKVCARKVGHHLSMADYPGTESVTISGLNGSFAGMGAYNNTRKEFILPLAETTGSNGYVNVQRYTNFDFDAYPSPKDAFANATLANTFEWQPGNWVNNNTESRYNSKWVLKDNGTLVHSVFFTQGGGMRTFYATVPTDNSTVTGTHHGQLSNTTSYGREQGAYYGQYIVPSRDGNAVCCTSPYYYYWSGSNTFLIDMKATSSYPAASQQYQSSSSSFGTSVLPYQDSGFAIWRLNNGYASGGSGPNWVRWWQRTKDASGNHGFASTSGMDGTRPATFPGYNTTDYPVLCAVTDYSSLKYNNNNKTTQPFNSSINTGAS